MNRTLMACIPVKPLKESTFQIKVPFYHWRTSRSDKIFVRKVDMLRKTAAKIIAYEKLARFRATAVRYILRQYASVVQ